MAKRALLIGSPFGGLTGVGNDVAAMAALLNQRGFAVGRCCHAEATRDGILDAWRRFVAETSDGDAAVIYYSGHGGLAVAAETEWRGAITTDAKHSWRYQFIVPVDFDETTDVDFRGIANVELSRLLRDLTARTRNVTLILDCCHSARMSRDLDLAPKALPKAWYLGVAGHVERLRMQGLLEGPTFVEGNPDAVRVVAAATTESAYEYTNPEGHRVGVLTESLGIALKAAGDRSVSWRSVLQRVRERVLGVVRQQHADVEGPVTRVLFGLDTVDASGTLGIGLDGGRHILRGGRLFGLEVGDVYAVMPFGAEGVDAAAQVAEATVMRVRAVTADVTLEYRDGQAALPEGGLAFPVRKALRRWAVRVEGNNSAAGELRSRLLRSKFVREAGPDEEDPPLAIVRLTDNQLELDDRAGLPLVRPQSPDPAGLSDTVANLENLARAQHLLVLEGGSGRYALDAPVAVEWGRVEAGRKEPLTASGETMLVSESLYVTLRNEGEVTVYASLFDIGVNGKVTLLSQSSPSGLELPKGNAYTLGEDDYDGMLTGLQLSWPDSAPADAPRRETVAVVLTSAPQDLRSLETDVMRTMRSAPERKGDGSELERILDQVSFGGLRDTRPPTLSVDVRYAVRRIDFMLDPSPLALPDLPPAAEWATTDRGYVFDERPDRSLARVVPRSPENLPRAVAVRLAELIIHRNKALFGGADLRLDCMLVTAAAGAPYRVQTAPFPAIRDNERLPLDNLLVFHGPVKDFLDIAVWISRDEPGSPTLAELLATELNSLEFKMAAGALAGVAALGPQGAATVVAIGAAATLTSIGARLIAAEIGKSIGLYRTWLLAAEGFGVGRHPSSGLLRSKDFSFAYEIIPV